MGENKDINITREEFIAINSNDELLALIKNKGINIDRVLRRLRYEDELRKLQIELVKLQQWISTNNKRVVIIFEGRDAAGKGGNIRRFLSRLPIAFGLFCPAREIFVS